MDFVSIDFETATEERFSPCEIGLTLVMDGKIQTTKSWLIKPITYPRFNHFNVSIHGITANDVAFKPTFNEIWPEISDFINNKTLIAHNAQFDMSVLRNTLNKYEIDLPPFSYGCSYLLSKRIWPELPSYNLKSLIV